MTVGGNVEVMNQEVVRLAVMVLALLPHVLRLRGVARKSMPWQVVVGEATTTTTTTAAATTATTTQLVVPRGGGRGRSRSSGSSRKPSLLLLW